MSSFSSGPRLIERLTIAQLGTRGDGIHSTPSDENPAKPTNKSPENTGLTDLPPAQPAAKPAAEACRNSST